MLCIGASLLCGATAQSPEWIDRAYPPISFVETRSPVLTAAVSGVLFLLGGRQRVKAQMLAGFAQPV